MNGAKRTNGWLAVTAALLLTLLLTGCAQQRIRDKSEAALRSGDYEQAIRGLEAGVKDYPDSALLRSGLVQARGEAQNRLVAEAASARAAGRAADAEATLKRAQALDPSNVRVNELLKDVRVERRQREALQQAEALLAKKQSQAALKVIAEALKDNPRQSDLLALQRRIEADERQRQVQVAAGGLAERRPISLDFRDASLRTVLDVVSRNSGINFILDKDIRPDIKVTVYLRSAKVEDAIDLITSTHQLSKKVLDSQTLLIYPNTAEKQREHQEQVVRVFYLASAEAKGAAAFLKSMLKIRDPYVDERSNMIALRDSQENIQLAERLISLYDSAEPEVLLEVEVIEISTNRLTELGVKFPDTFSLTPLPPSGAPGLTLGNVRDLTRNDIALSIGGVQVNLHRDTGDFNILANPRIRAKNKEKAKILIGDKVPIVTTTTGTGGFVSDSVNYIDVGLKLDVEPTVYVDDEVAIKIALEVSSLAQVIKTTSGTLAYQIGTRNAATLLRLRDGETQLLAGLISNSERSTSNRVPGAGDLPIVGRLFSSQRDDNQRTELVLSITPHILRNVHRPDATETELWVGTESTPRMRPAGGIATVATAAETAPPRASTAAPGPGTTAASADASAPAASGTALSWSGPSRVKVGQEFVATLTLSTDVALRGLPLRLAFTKDRLALIEVGEGDFFKQGGVATSLTKQVGEGTAQAGVLRNQASGASGQGVVFTIKAKATSAGAAEFSVTGADPIGLGGPAAMTGALPSLRIQVE